MEIRIDGRKALLRLLEGEAGQGLVEYGLVIVLIAIALVLSLTALQGSIAGLLTRIEAALG